MAKKNASKQKRKKDGWFFTRSLLEEIHDLEVEDEPGEKLPIVASVLGIQKTETQKENQLSEKVEREKNKRPSVSTESMVSKESFEELQQAYKQVINQLSLYKEQEVRYQQLEADYAFLQAENKEEPRVSTATMVAFQQETKEQVTQLREDNEALSHVIETNESLFSAERDRYRQELIDITLAKETLFSEKEAMQRQLETIRQELSEKSATALLVNEQVLSLEEEQRKRTYAEEQLTHIEAVYQENKKQWSQMQEESARQIHDFNLLTDALEQQINNQREELANNQTKIQQLTNTISQQEVSIRAHDSSYSSVEEENHQLQERLVTLEAQVITARKQTEETMEENELLTQALKKLLTSNEVMREALETQNISEEAEESVLVEAQEKIQVLEAQVQTMEEENKQLQETTYLEKQRTEELMLVAQEQANQLLMETQETVQQKIQTAELALSVINSGAQKIFSEVDTSRQTISSIYEELEMMVHQVVKGETLLDTDGDTYPLA